MRPARALHSLAGDLVTAFGFLTRLPQPTVGYDEGSLARAAKFFPLVGLVLGYGASLLHAGLLSHLPPMLCALAVLLALVLATGALHEDGLADAADAFGGGLRDRSRILLILRDSRIGSYGALALIFSLAARLLLLATLSPSKFAAYVVAASVLSRWSSLPLGLWLAPARAADDGLGARLAQRITGGSVAAGTALALGIVVPALRESCAAPLVASVAVAILSGLFYRRRLGGITGDCFGATNQLTEIAVLCCGVWR